MNKSDLILQFMIAAVTGLSARPGQVYDTIGEDAMQIAIDCFLEYEKVEK